MQETTLEIGRLQTVLVRQPWVPYVRATLALRAGSAYEDERCFGFSHFLEHLIFLSRADGGDRPLDLIEGLGGEIEASTGRETTFIELRIDTEHLGVALAALARLAFDFNLGAAELEREKNVLEYESRDDETADVLDTRAKELLWPDDTLFDDALGDLDLIRGASVADLETHHRRFYHPGNALLVVAGGFDPSMAARLATAAFAPYADRPGERADYKPPRVSQRRVLVECLDDEDDANDDEEEPILDVLIAFRGWDYDEPQNLGLYLLSELLAGNQTSRLFRALREDNPLTYSVESYVDSFLHAGCLSLYGSAPSARLDAYMQEVCRTFGELRELGPTSDELERARRGLGTWFGNDLFTPSVATDFAVRRYLLGLSSTWWDPPSFRAALAEATPASLRETARALLRPERTVAVLAGPGARERRQSVAKMLASKL